MITLASIQKTSEGLPKNKIFLSNNDYHCCLDTHELILWDNLFFALGRNLHEAIAFL